MFDVNKFALSAGLTGSVLFFIKFLLMWTMGFGVMMPMRGMMRFCPFWKSYGMMGKNAIANPMSFGWFFGGIIWMFVIAFIAGWIFAWVYNKLTGK